MSEGERRSAMAIPMKMDRGEHCNTHDNIAFKLGVRPCLYREKW